MKATLVAALLLLAALGRAQEVRFTDASNTWSVLAIGTGGEGWQSEVRYVGTKLIKGRLYSELNHKFTGIREDAALRKVYFLDDSVERVLFDYNLKLNDTFKLVAHRSQTDTVLLMHTVESVDSVKIGSVFHKTWNMRCITPNALTTCLSYTFIEGVGTNFGPMFSSLPVFFEGCSQLRCFTTKGTQPKFSPAIKLPCEGPILPGYPQPIDRFDNDTSCSFWLSVDDRTVPAGPVLLNSGTKTVALSIPAQMASLSLRVVDMAGRAVIQERVDGKTEFPLGAHLRLPGLYLYRLQNERTGQQWRGTFVY